MFQTVINMSHSVKLLELQPKIDNSTTQEYKAVLNKSQYFNHIKTFIYFNVCVPNMNFSN